MLGRRRRRRHHRRTLTGAASLFKRDLGTLVLSGPNTYSGGTVVEAVRWL